MESVDPVRVGAWEWCRRFCELYNSSASSPLTMLGLFYERHRKFVEYGQRSDPGDPEYTDEEWTRVMATLLGELAGILGLVQAPDREGRPQLEWYLPGVPDKPTVIIRETSDEGRPVTVSDPGSPHAQLFREIAARVWSKVSGEGARRVPPRIVIE